MFSGLPQTGSLGRYQVNSGAFNFWCEHHLNLLQEAHNFICLSRLKTFSFPVLVSGGLVLSYKIVL